MRQKRVFPRDSFGRDDSLSPWRKAPASRTEGSVQDATVFDLWEIDYAIRLDLNVIDINWGEEDIGGLFGEGLGGEALERIGPVDRFRIGRLCGIVGQAGVGDIADGLLRRIGSNGAGGLGERLAGDTRCFGGRGCGSCGGGGWLRLLEKCALGGKGAAGRW